VAPRTLARAQIGWSITPKKVNYFGLLAEYIFSLHEEIANTFCSTFLGPPQWHRNNQMILEFRKREIPK
jgi:hypothetical protein